MALPRHGHRRRGRPGRGGVPVCGLGPGPRIVAAHSGKDRTPGPRLGPAGGRGRDHCGLEAARYDQAGRVREFGPGGRHGRPLRPDRGERGRDGDDHGPIGRAGGPDPGHRPRVPRREARPLRQPGGPDLHQARLQLGGVPRQGERSERVPAQPPRLRAGARLRVARQGRARAPALPGRARAELVADQGHGQGPPRGGASAWRPTRTNSASSPAGSPGGCPSARRPTRPSPGSRSIPTRGSWPAARTSRSS